MKTKSASIVLLLKKESAEKIRKVVLQRTNEVNPSGVKNEEVEPGSNQEKLINVPQSSENPFLGRLKLRFLVFWLAT